MANSVKQWQTEQSGWQKHPLWVLADNLYSRRWSNNEPQLRANGSTTLKAVVKNQPILLDVAKHSGSLHLPIINVAANLVGNGALGIATCDMIDAAPYQKRSNPSWWHALLQTVSENKCYESLEYATNHPRLALACVYKQLNFLQLLTEEEYAVFKQSWAKLPF